MTNSTLEKLTAIIAILGEAKVEALYQLTGSEKISAASLRKIIKKEKIKSSIKDNKPFAKVVTESGLHRSTIYRNLKK